MESSLVLSSSSSSSPSSSILRSRDAAKLSGSSKSRFFYKNGSSFVSTQKLSIQRRNSVVVAARKGPKKKDTGIFVNTEEIFYPESVLLKEKKLQEDGSFRPDFADEKEKNLYEALTIKLESDHVERVRHYEVVYLIHEANVDELESVNQKIKDFLAEKRGRIWRVNDWGVRRLAYRILNASNAHYMLMNFEIEAKWINDFKSMLDTDLRIIRHLVIQRDEAITEVAPPPPDYHTLQDSIVYEDDDDDDDEDWEDDDEEYEEYDEEYDDEEEGEGEGEEEGKDEGEEDTGDDKKDKINGKGGRKREAEKVER